LLNDREVARCRNGAGSNGDAVACFADAVGVDFGFVSFEEGVELAHMDVGLVDDIQGVEGGQRHEDILSGRPFGS